MRYSVLIGNVHAAHRLDQGRTNCEVGRCHLRVLDHKGFVHQFCVAEYALRGVAKPMGVAEYQLLRQVPESLGTTLPSIYQIEAGFGQICPTLNTGAATGARIREFSRLIQLKLNII